MKYDDGILRRSQFLRKNMTKEERHLWYDYLKEYPLQFRRQYPIGCYFADFFCHKARLIVELDGSQHCEPDEIAYDKKRTEYLERQGYFVLPFSNRDVMGQFPAVCDAIDAAVSSRLQG